MPSIITTPDRQRNDSRGLSEADAKEYVELMEKAGENEVVTVDESETDGYEKSYSKGERVRNAIKKFNLTERSVKVQAVKDDEGKFQAVVSFKD